METSCRVTIWQNKVVGTQNGKHKEEPGVLWNNKKGREESATYELVASDTDGARGYYVK